MEKIRILCYGDSNTWGAIVPGKERRFDRLENRFTKLVQKYSGGDLRLLKKVSLPELVTLMT